jgi:hypothetical protein
MHIINAHFERLSDISVLMLLGEIGVYVLWNGRAKARPSYIGEGNILNRLVTHHDRFAKPFDGFAAVLSYQAIPWQRAKADATILEAMLLAVAEDTDRMPSTNIAPGKLRDLDDILRSHGRVRINVTGLDPLRPPEERPNLVTKKCIVLRFDKEEDFEVRHDWRLRRLRK